MNNIIFGNASNKEKEALQNKFHRRFGNASNIRRVSKNRTSQCKQGFTWRYVYHENGKQKVITSVNMEKLEQKVKNKGLPWEEV